MNTLRLILACLLLASCATTPPPQPPNPPTPPAPVSGRFLIREYNTAGHLINSYQVTTYVETDFPRCVSFIHDGTQVFLRGSYQIDEFPR